MKYELKELFDDSAWRGTEIDFTKSPLSADRLIRRFQLKNSALSIKILCAQDADVEVFDLGSGDLLIIRCSIHGIYVARKKSRVFHVLRFYSSRIKCSESMCALLGDGEVLLLSKDCYVVHEFQPNFDVEDFYLSSPQSVTLKLARGSVLTFDLHETHSCIEKKPWPQALLH